MPQRVAEIFGMEAEEMRGSGKNANMVPARSVFCYWAARELGVREKEFFRDCRKTLKLGILHFSMVFKSLNFNGPKIV